MPQQAGWPPQPGPYPPYLPPGPPQSVWQRLREDEWPPLRELLGGRIRGCAWSLLLIPCTWAVFLPVVLGYPLARSARRSARRIFPSRGHRRIEDPEVMRVQKTRAWLATLMSVVILVAYGRPEDMAQAEEQFMFRLIVTPWLLLLSTPVVVAMLFRWASPAAKDSMRVRLRAAGRSAVRYIGAFTAVPLLSLGAYGVQQVAGPDAAGYTAIALMVPMLWAALFVVFATGPAVRSAFNTAAVHAALPALLTGVLVWEFAVIGLVMGGPPPGPPLVQACSLLGGPASVTAVVWWEVQRLRTRYGVALRG
ncbi:hypothetical protein ACWERY_14420 [Streptomyces sp. NPDC004082]|uniref:hypothetical protein n=1 Tax=unclassified Streptomyces TaxID=2593676 RepID=UPI0033AD3152